jgi:hypothetical protein
VVGDATSPAGVRRDRLTEEDRRGLSALFWTHLNLCGRFELDMNNHLELGLDGQGAGEGGK